MDHLSNLISSIKVGTSRGNLYTRVGDSRFIRNILDFLIKEGYIGGYSVEGYYLLVYLKYYQGNSLIKDITLLSKRGKRIYYSKNRILKEGLKGNYLVYTGSKGISSSFQVVERKAKEGGEVLFHIII